MRIVLIGQAAFGAKTIEALLAKGENVAAVYAPPDKPGGKADPLKEAAVSYGIEVYQPSRYKDEQVFAQFQSLNPDLAILAFVTDIIPSRYFDACTVGAICYHPSILPRHRGVSAINWAVAMGDAKTGLTIFWPDGGIDTGPILLQKEIAIDPGDTTGSLYFNHLFPMGVDAIMESVALIKAGKAPRTPQPEEGATYEPPCDDRVASIDWNKAGWDIYNLVRGCDPQPGAYVLWKGEKIRLYGVKLLKGSTGKRPGTVVQVDQEGIHAAVPEGELVIEKVRAAKGGKLPAADFAVERGLQVGDVLGE
jgi:methionyl-tRNA formyltransferase